MRLPWRERERKREREREREREKEKERERDEIRTRVKGRKFDTRSWCVESLGTEIPGFESP